jgi:hypothetical protein
MSIGLITNFGQISVCIRMIKNSVHLKIKLNLIIY